MSRPVCGACGELDVTSDPCRCHPPAPLDAAVEEAREALGEIPPNAEDTRITSLIRCAKALRSLLAALDADRGEAEAIVRTIVENHFARITERGVLVYGQPVADTGFAAAIHWLARREGKGENRES